MNVETFEVIERELGEHAPEDEAEAVILIRELGLEGQEELLSHASGVTTRCPYREMSVFEVRVYAEICPKTTPLGQYNAGPIPLRVLQIASHAKSIFDFIYVLHPTQASEKDPVLVGSHEEKGYGAIDKPFILARWGEELLSFEELAIIAGEKWIAKAEASARTKIGECKNFIEAIDSHMTKHFDGDWVHTP